MRGGGGRLRGEMERREEGGGRKREGEKRTGDTVLPGKNQRISHFSQISQNDIFTFKFGSPLVVGLGLK